MATTRTARKATKKPVTLTSKVEAFLVKNAGKTFTYNQVAKRLKTKAVAVANATRSIRKVNPVLASLIVTARPSDISVKA